MLTLSAEQTLAQAVANARYADEEDTLIPVPGLNLQAFVAHSDTTAQPTAFVPRSCQKNFS